MDTGFGLLSYEPAYRLLRRSTPVGASLLAKVVNDNAVILDVRVAWTFFASKN